MLVVVFDATGPIVKCGGRKPFYPIEGLSTDPVVMGLRALGSSFRGLPDPLAVTTDAYGAAPVVALQEGGPKQCNRGRGMVGNRRLSIEAR